MRGWCANARASRRARARRPSARPPRAALDGGERLPPSPAPSVRRRSSRTPRAPGLGARPSWSSVMRRASPGARSGRRTRPRHRSAGSVLVGGVVTPARSARTASRRHAGTRELHAVAPRRSAAQKAARPDGASASAASTSSRESGVGPARWLPFQRHAAALRRSRAALVQRRRHRRERRRLRVPHRATCTCPPPRCRAPARAARCRRSRSPPAARVYSARRPAPSRTPRRARRDAAASAWCLARQSPARASADSLRCARRCRAAWHLLRAPDPARRAARAEAPRERWRERALPRRAAPPRPLCMPSSGAPGDAVGAAHAIQFVTLDEPEHRAGTQHDRRSGLRLSAVTKPTIGSGVPGHPRSAPPASAPRSRRTHRRSARRA